MVIHPVSSLSSKWIPLICLAAGLAGNLLFWLFWRVGLRRYNSAGG
jgi:ABC-type uncharacterized transport system permease subunit